MRSFFTYTAARFLLFAVAFGVVYLLGARSYLALALALVLSALASYVVLSPQRDAMSGQVVRWFTNLRDVGRRLEEGAQREDADRERDGVDAATDSDEAEKGTGDAGDTSPAPDSARDSSEHDHAGERAEDRTDERADAPEPADPDREDAPTAAGRERPTG